MPILVQYVQAASVLFIAGIGAWIAFRQMHIAATKLQHDLFDRRYRVFAATRRLLADVFVRGDSSDEALSAFILGVADAAFLFDDSLVVYLNEMSKHVRSLRSVKSVMESHPVGDERAKVSSVAGEHQMWLMY